MTITGINIVRNCIENGYPFIESILSILPICDKYFVNDGGSTDGTKQVLDRLSQSYPNKIQVFNIKDTANIRWDCVSDQINQMIKHVKTDWIFLGNADELLHEKDIKDIKKTLEHTNMAVMRFNRMEIKHDWSRMGKDVYHPARVARKQKGLYQDWNAYGGDEFLLKGKHWIDPHRNNKTKWIIYHLYNVFPENKINKLRNDAEYLAPGDKHRVQLYEIRKKSKLVYRRPIKVYEGLPILAKGLAYMPKYYVRECLFDKDWLKMATGHTY